MRALIGAIVCSFLILGGCGKKDESQTSESMLDKARETASATAETAGDMAQSASESPSEGYDATKQAGAEVFGGAIYCGWGYLSGNTRDHLRL